MKSKSKKVSLWDIMDDETKSKAFEKKKKDIGVVVDCLRLNVRVAPSLSAGILATLPFNTQMEIDDSGSTEDFYHISYVSARGNLIDGYCRKEYVSVHNADETEG